MLVKRETIEKNPDLVFELVLAHARATEYLKANQDQWLKRAATFGTAPNILEKAAPNMELAWSMDEAFIAKTRALGERMQALGVIERQPDYDKLFELSFVRKVPARLKP
jgi:NitT/TauT family transport system substrate-binding protein